MASTEGKAPAGYNNSKNMTKETVIVFFKQSVDYKNSPFKCVIAPHVGLQYQLFLGSRDFSH